MHYVLINSLYVNNRHANKHLLNVVIMGPYTKVLPNVLILLIIYL